MVHEPLCAHAASPTRWWVLLVVTLMNILQAMLWNTFSPISEVVKVAYGWSDGNFEWSVNVANMSFLLALLPTNKLYKRSGARVTMLWATGFLCVCGLLRCVPLQGPGFLVLVQLSMLANGVTAAWANMSCAIISDLWFPVRQRTLATAVAVTGPPVGQALGFAVPALLTVSQRTQVQQLMCLEAFSCCFLFLAAWLHFPGAPGTPPSASSLRRTAHEGYARLLRPGAWRFWLLNLSFAVPVGIYQSWCSVLNLNLPHTTLSAQNVAVLGSMMTLSGAAGSIFIGLATRRLLGALKSILLLCALCSALGFFTFAKLLTSGEGAWALGASGVLGGFGLNCMPPLFFELIFESSYHLVSEHVASTCMLLSVSSMQILVLLVPVKIAGSSLWMNWLMLAAMVMCLCGLLPVRPRYDRLAADLGVDVACGCDRCGW